MTQLTIAIADLLDVPDGDTVEAVREFEAALSDITSAWERYQRGSLSREEFEGIVAARRKGRKG